MAGPWEAYAQPKASAGPWEAYASEAPKSDSGGILKNALRSYNDLGAGMIKGAADIGATILSPVDKLTDMIKGDREKNLSGLITGKQPLSRNEERRSQIAESLKDITGANPDSLAFKGGELAADVAGTAGVGGAIAKGAQVAKYAPKLAAALESGGFNLNAPAATTLAGKAGDLALRTGAGATVGAASAGLVNPSDVGAGAAIGAALPGAVKAAGVVGTGLRSAADHILGAMTGTSAETVKSAFQAGKAGSTEFLDNMRGKVPFDDVVDSAKEGLRNMRAERAQQYRSGMVNIKNDKTVLDMSPIVKSVQDMQASGNFKGKAINEKAAGTIQEIADKVDDWAKSAANEYHTPEGLDALKQAIGDIRDSTQFGTPARRAADNVYNSIKSQIQKQAPTYAEVMKDYSTASRELQEIEKSLSLGDKTSKDTAIRKLQSLMRNNAQSNYGNRLKLGETLEDKGGVSLRPAIAGQAMSAILPRGMVGAIEKVGMAGAPFLAPGMLMAAPLTSPRLVGEAMYGAGKLSGGARNALAKVVGGSGQNQNQLSAISNPAIRNALIQAMRANQSNP